MLEGLRRVEGGVETFLPVGECTTFARAPLTFAPRFACACVWKAETEESATPPRLRLKTMEQNSD